MGLILPKALRSVLIAAKIEGILKETTTTNQASKKEESKQDELKSSYAIVETAKYKGIEMTVLNIDKSNGSEYDIPKDGKEFVIVRVKMKNNAKVKLVYNPFYFKIRNSRVQIEDETFSNVNEDTALKSWELAPGGEVEGTVVFEETVGDKGMLLQYQDNIFSDKVKIS